MSDNSTPEITNAQLRELSTLMANRFGTYVTTYRVHDDGQRLEHCMTVLPTARDDKPASS